jgi:hypothetical protein
MKNIERIQENNIRYYMDFQTGNKFPSVSEILNKMEDKKYLESWKKRIGNQALTEKEKMLPSYQREKIATKKGEIESRKIQDYSRDRGNLIHAQIEENTLNPKNKTVLEKKQLSLFTEQYIKPVKIGDTQMIETKVMWSDKGIGFGGTFDYYAQFQKPLRDFKTSREVAIPQALIDWKNPLNIKYAESWSKQSGKYYPLTKYFLQAAAYTGALNQMVENPQHKVNKTLVVLNPQKSKNTIYLYYCDAFKTNFYWEKFKEILDCYFSNKVFNWDKLNKEIEENSVIPKRITL